MTVRVHARDGMKLNKLANDFKVQPDGTLALIRHTVKKDHDFHPDPPVETTTVVQIFASDFWFSAELVKDAS